MFPTLSEYNKTIQAQGANAFRTLNNIFFIPARTTPIKIYSFGSGSFAVVFKALENDKEIAIRCFIGTDNDYVERYRKIDSYLKTIKENWKTNIQFLENEIEINGKLFPVVKMDWVEGKLLDRFLNNNLQNNEVLSELQKQIFKVSRNLEKNKIAHGDIQCGNIIIKEVNGKPKVKLIDYDGMYIPDFIEKKQIERGRSEFQHPNRKSFAFNERIDRFSFWVILCALEALKFDKTLWKEIMQGGFNTLDNLLFVASDFNNPNQSKLFNRLEILNQPSLDFYLEQIKNSLITSTVEQVKLFGQIENIGEDLQIIEKEQQYDKSTPPNIRSSDQIEHVNITSFPTGASVRNKNYVNIGITPIKIDKNKYLNEEIKIIFGTKSRSIIVDESANEIYINFDKIILTKPIIEKTEPVVAPVIEQNPNNQSWPIIFFILIIISIIGFVAYHYNNINYNDTLTSYDSTAVEAVDTAAVADTVANYSISNFTDTDTTATVLNEENIDTVATTTFSPEVIDDYNDVDIASNLYRNYFVGRWSDENSVFIFYPDGDYYIKWDTSNSKFTKWEFINGKLYIGLGDNSSLLRHYILDYTSNYFKYRAVGDNTIYTAYRIGN